MTDLTEQWKKGELPAGRYWVKYRSGRIDDWDLLGGKTIETKPEIVEVLAPVPSFKEWQKVLNIDFNNEVLRLENQQLKKLLNYIRDEIADMPVYAKQMGFGWISEAAYRIDNSIGEKK